MVRIARRGPHRAQNDVDLRLSRKAETSRVIGSIGKGGRRLEGD